MLLAFKIGVAEFKRRESLADLADKSIAHGAGLDAWRLDEIKSYVGFDEVDARQLLALRSVVADSLDEVVQRFYDTVQAHPEAAKVFREGVEQIERQKPVLKTWLSELFDGGSTPDYCERRAAIGRAHVTVALPQRYVLTAMEVVWQELSRIIRRANPPEIEAKLSALHKLLTIELSIMLETYMESYAAKVRSMERNLVEKRLTRAEHLAEIGQLAASLAHEIKNPLAGISGAIQVLRDDMGSDDPKRAIIGEVLAQISRLDAAVKDLLIYARPTDPRPDECALDVIVQRVLMVLNGEPALQGLDVTVRIVGPHPNLVADERQLEQLVMNLIINASHASSEGSAIRIEIQGDEDNVGFSVRDFGKGIPEQVRVHVFEPFYTTKAKGTGLGLCICRRIVESHGGSIAIESESGQGTTVTVLLPRHATMHPKVQKAQEGQT